MMGPAGGWYAYVGNNPVKYNDPTGHDDIPWWVPIMATMSDSLISIGDSNRNPRIAEFHNTFWNGVNSWSDVGNMSVSMASYTSEAVKESRWSDAVRGVGGMLEGAQVISNLQGEVGKTFAVGIITTPIRIFSSDIPEFCDSVSERQQGKDRFWDVLFTGTNLMGDVNALYGLGKGAAKGEEYVTNMAREGRELKLGNDFRIAPFGNRRGNPEGELPHYHRRGIGSDGRTIDGQGIGRHRPWQVNPSDKSFWDRW